MRIFELLNYIERIAPKQISWEKDNSGFQIGNTQDKINKITLALDIDSEVVENAIKTKSNLIITHHPFIFNPIRSIIFDDPKGKIISKLISNKINLACFHTNLDFMKDGVSFALAKKLGLENIRFLKNHIEKKYKLVTFIPVDYAEKLVQVLSEKGAGKIGEYSECSFQVKGNGTFRGSHKSHPTVGMKQKFEKVEEVRIEMIFDEWNKDTIINTLCEIHPYEEPAYDIYKLQNKNLEYGFGAYGELKEEMSLEKFYEIIKKKLGVKYIKFTTSGKNIIKRVAVCGGSGKELIIEAIKKNCDMYLTSEIGYHLMIENSERIRLVEIEHNYSEYPILPFLENKLESFFSSKNEKIKINVCYPKKEKIDIYK